MAHQGEPTRRLLVRSRDRAVTESIPATRQRTVPLPHPRPAVAAPLGPPAGAPPATTLQAAPRRGAGPLTLCLVALLAAGLGGAATFGAHQVLRPAPVTASRAPATPAAPDWPRVAADTRESVATLSLGVDGTRRRGSALVYDAQGHLVTTFALVEGYSGENIEVRLPGDRMTRAKVLGSDRLTNLAVLELTEQVDGLHPVRWAEQRPSVGDAALAVAGEGSADASFSPTTITDVAQPVQVATQYQGDPAGEDATALEAVRFPAPLSASSAGSVLTDTEGAALAMLLPSDARDDSDQGRTLGLGLPGTTVRRVADLLVRGEQPVAPRVGMNVEDASVDTGNGTVPGARVTFVEEDSPAWAAGLRNDMLIYQVDGRAVDGRIAVVTTIRRHGVGEEVAFTVVREGGQQEVMRATTEPLAP